MFSNKVRCFLLLLAGLVAFIEGIKATPASDSGLSERISKIEERLSRLEQRLTKEPSKPTIKPTDDPLKFHARRGRTARVSDDGRIASRADPSNEIMDATVLTHRSLRPNELFEVRIEKTENHWTSSVQIGVTANNPETLEIPPDMQVQRTGTWLYYAKSVVYNGEKTIESYGNDLRNLLVGDRIGVARLDDGTLHFYIDGVDQGVAATNVPPHVWGFIDVYGRTTEVSIV